MRTDAVIAVQRDSAPVQIPATAKIRVPAASLPRKTATARSRHEASCETIRNGGYGQIPRPARCRALCAMEQPETVGPILALLRFSRDLGTVDEEIVLLRSNL